MVRFGPYTYTVRCLSCQSGATHLSLIASLDRLPLQLEESDCYELSTRGPFYEFLKSKARSLLGSEYLDGHVSGDRVDGVLVQNIEGLSFQDEQFDLVTSTEVFEHVADDRKGFQEIHRVLRPGGFSVFTVPIDPSSKTFERAKVVDGEIQYLAEPHYHGDAIRGDMTVLVFRDYGGDITERLLEAGFESAWIDQENEKAFLGMGQPIVVAKKAQ